jgi:hypothetical protein
MTSNTATVERIQTYQGVFEKSLRFAVSMMRAVTAVSCDDTPVTPIVVTARMVAMSLYSIDVPMPLTLTLDL